MIHIILFILNICSILILVALIADYKPFVCDYTPEAVDLINDIIKDLCIGVITSTIFYYIVFFAIVLINEFKGNIFVEFDNGIFKKSS